MRANVIALAILAAVTCGAFLRAEPATCYDCLTGGNPCWAQASCGMGCTCLRINGPGAAGVCG